MKYAIFLGLMASALAAPAPQGVTEQISPPEPNEEGCSPDAPGAFQIQVMNVTSSQRVKVCQERRLRWKVEA